MELKIILFLFFLGGMNLFVFAQNDSLIFKNDSYLVGEVQGMLKGVLEIETDFSENDFQVEWNEIQELYVKTNFLISLKNGDVYNGNFGGTKDNIKIYTLEYDTISISLDEIFYIRSVERSFKDRLIYSIDLGLSITKANNLTNFSTSSKLGYSALKWTLEGDVNSIVSDQDDQETTRNIDGGITFRYILHKGWFLSPEVVFLSNTQQNINLRTNTKFGGGNFFVRSNRMYWSAFGGISSSNEKFSGDTPDRKSWEAFFGTDVDMFDVGDLNFALKANAYPSITEKNRFRLDGNFITKYDLPLNLYIKFGVTYNFDNQPAEGGSKSNYTYQTGIGWEL